MPRTGGCGRTLHWLPVQHRIEYKVALLTFKEVRSGPQRLDAVVPATPNPGSRTRPQPAIDHYGAASTFHAFTTTTFAKRAFRCYAPAVWTSVPQTVLSSDSVAMPSVRWRCWLGVWKSVRPVETNWWGVGVVVCPKRGADCLHTVQLMPLPSPKPRHLLPHSNPDWFHLSGTGLLRLSRKRGR